MRIVVELQPTTSAAPGVAYTWDADTEILSAQVTPRPTGSGMSGSVGLEGSDGSWVILDVAAGRINGVEIAVWPDVRQVSTLSPPSKIEDLSVIVPTRRSQPDIASLEVDTRLVAEADQAQRTFHFRLGKPRESRAVRVATDLLVEVDDQNRLSGLWLLNVPPSPAET